MRLYVGSYTKNIEGMDGSGEGIYEVECNPLTGQFSQAILRAKCQNPSAMVLSNDRKYLFAAREVFAAEKPGITAYAVAENGDFLKTSRINIDGELPCHLSYDPVGNRISSSQYGSGDVVICDVVDGQLSEPSDVLVREGTGPNLERQEGPHAHFAAFTDDGKYLHLIDLGCDVIVTHRIGDTRQVDPVSVVQLPKGSGPRHMVIDKNEQNAYVVCELDETIVHLKRSAMGWKLQNVAPVFDGRTVDGACAAIRLSHDERFLYISGRRQSAIACFSTHEGLEKQFEIDSGGKNPREFVIGSSGSWIIVANQESHELASFKRDRLTGAMIDSGYRCDVPSPVAIVEN